MPSFKFASATGSGSSLIVTCSDQFAGKTITCSNGTKTYTRTCPSTSPYEVVFKGVAPGTWTVSGVVEGTTYSQQVVITDFDVTLTAGLDYKQWVTLGGLDPTDYASLSEVLADEVAVRRLMTIHASADYLIEKVTDDIDTIDDFTANDIAMKWIGLRDYICDGLTAITGVEAKFLASAYWERYLKDHVPVMTSNTAPYGTASASNVATDNTTYAFYAFDNNDSTKFQTNGGTTNLGRLSYKFANPIEVRKIAHKSGSLAAANTFSIQYSDNGTTWTTVDTYTIPSRYVDAYEKEIDGVGHHLYWAVNHVSASADTRFVAYSLQFYGRSLDVSVPVMTSNTAPYGEAIGNTGLNNVLPYVVFDNDSSTAWQSASTTVGSYHGIGYEFINKVVIKNVFISTATYCALKNGVIQGSNDGNTWEDVYTISSTLDVNTEYYFTFSNSVPYKYYRIYGQLVDNCVGYKTIQFYGVDYTEREFAEGSTMKYLYDYGIELETIDITGTATKGNDYITLSAANAQASHTLNLTPYDLLRGKVGDHMRGTTALIAGTTATANMTAANAPNNESLNVSSVNALLATGAKMTAAGVCDITELWLE